MNYLNQLEALNKTCIIYSQESIVFTSTKKGVSPLIDYLENKKNLFSNLLLVDKIIGKGAVILAEIIGITEIHTPIISKDALELAKTYNIKCRYLEEVPYIINRDKTGRCPIESCVLDITDPKEGYIKIVETLQKLQKVT